MHYVFCPFFKWKHSILQNGLAAQFTANSAIQHVGILDAQPGLAYEIVAGPCCSPLIELAI